MGIIAANQGRVRQSLRYLERALELYANLGDAPFDEGLTRTAIEQVRVMVAERAGGGVPRTGNE
jgi:hypothetical protein